MIRKLAGVVGEMIAIWQRPPAVQKVHFEPRWKEELLCRPTGKWIVFEMIVGVYTVRFPTLATWQAPSPEWAWPEYDRIPSGLSIWCDRKDIGLRIQDDATVRFE